MILHQHPYPPFIPAGATKLIVGTIPPPRFSTGELFDQDVDFGYGSKYGLLWPILERLFNDYLDYQNTARAIEQRKSLLSRNGIGICDMVESCSRERMESSDLGMREIKLRNLLAILKNEKQVKRLLFMGGNTKNGPEYLFRRLVKSSGIKLEPVQDRPRLQSFYLGERRIDTVSLISPSNAANRSIGANLHYKSMKKQNPSYSTLDYRIEQYRDFFLD